MTALEVFFSTTLSSGHHFYDAQRQARGRPRFSSFFLALTECEISATEQLGIWRGVALYHNLIGERLLTSVPESWNNSWGVTIYRAVVCL